MSSLTTEQEMLVSQLEDLAREEFADRAFEWDGEPPWENVELLADRGFLGINISEEYGGGGMGEFEAMLTIEAVGRVCPDTAEFLYNQQMVAPRTVEMFGTEAAKEEYLPGITAGEESMAVAISEPEAGSDVGSMKTHLEEADDGGYYLTGEKIWVSNVEHSRSAVVWTKFPDGNVGGVIMEFDADGVSIDQHYTNMFDHKQTQFRMDEVYIPEENVLTSGREGFIEMLQALNWERLGSATFANAMAANAIEKALEYAQNRVQFDQPIADFQGIEWKLADMVKQYEASRALTHRAAQNAAEQGRIPDRLDASLAKVFSGEMVEDVVSESLQIHGANGYQQGHPLENLYRRARARRLAAGTDEIQKNQIAAVLKKDGLAKVSEL